MEGWLRAGLVGSPHGLDGSFHVNRSVPGLLELGKPVNVRERSRLIVRRAGHEARLILRLEGCENRDAAAALGGAELLVARSAAPELPDDEWWAEDLEGCAVHDGEAVVGTVARLLALPSCELLEVQRSGGQDPLLVPLIADAVRAVDVAERRIDVDLGFLGEAP